MLLIVVPLKTYRKFGRPKWILSAKCWNWSENGQWPTAISSTAYSSCISKIHWNCRIQPIMVESLACMIMYSSVILIYTYFDVAFVSFVQTSDSTQTVIRNNDYNYNLQATRKRSTLAVNPCHGAPIDSQSGKLNHHHHHHHHHHHTTTAIIARAYFML